MCICYNAPLVEFKNVHFGYDDGTGDSAQYQF